MSVPHIAPPKGMRKFEFKQSKYPHLDGMAPIRCIVTGSSGSGKGILIFIAKHMDFLWIWASQMGPKWWPKWLRKSIKNNIDF